LPRGAYVKQETGPAARARLETILARAKFQLREALSAGRKQEFVADGRTREAGPVPVIALRGTESAAPVPDVRQGIPRARYRFKHLCMMGWGKRR
jgi:hypothetical protein